MRSSTASTHIFNEFLAQDTRCEFGELTGDGLRRFPLVRPVRESLRDNQIQPLSDWGQVVAGSNPVSPTQVRGSFAEIIGRLFHTPRGVDSNG